MYVYSNSYEIFLYIIIDYEIHGTNQYEEDASIESSEDPDDVISLNQQESEMKYSTTVSIDLFNGHGQRPPTSYGVAGGEWRAHE